jgi:hypothetical protein
MSIVISDTNVFVALYKANLLMKVFSIHHASIHIPLKVYEELTLNQHRVHREFPQLSQLITDLVYNPNHGHPITLSVHRIQNSLSDISALNAHYILEAESAIGAGEMEAIPLSIELSGIFLSSDTDAMDEYHSIQNRNNSTGFLFVDYCKRLKSQGDITQAELADIITAITT